MTGQEFQDKLDAIVTDLQTTGAGKSVQVMFRDAGNSAAVAILSSTNAGVVNAGQLADIQGFVDGLKTTADQYNTDIAPYTVKAAELKVIAESPAYIAARATYKTQNVTENYAELSNAKGAYITV